MLLKDKTAVITGCNRGIGKKILEVFSENGATVFACARSIDEKFKSFLKELTKKTGSEIIPIQFDLNDEKKIKDAAENILKTNKHIDILINNAATIHTAIFQMTSIKKLKEVFEINFFAGVIWNIEVCIVAALLTKISMDLFEASMLSAASFIFFSSFKSN